MQTGLPQAFTSDRATKEPGTGWLIVQFELVNPVLSALVTILRTQMESPSDNP
jgi:hypothetical protein